jgi:salicylate hydroxylase
MFHGSAAYRGLVPHERLADWPSDRWQMWLGTGRPFLTLPVRAGKLINYVGFVPTDEQMTESWSAPGDPRHAAAGTLPARPEQRGAQRHPAVRSD